MISDNFPLSAQAQALACLISLDRYTVPEPLRLFDTTLQLISDFAELAFGRPCAEQFRELSARYAALVDKPTFHSGVFQAILSFCNAGSGRLEAASSGLADARLHREELPLYYARWYQQHTRGQLLATADELSRA